jgi:hypothetical protein
MRRPRAEFLQHHPVRMPPRVRIKDGKEFVTVASAPHLLRRALVYRSREQIHASRKRAIFLDLLCIAPIRRGAPVRGIHKSHMAYMSRLSRTLSRTVCSSCLRSLVRRKSFLLIDRYSSHRHKFLIMVGRASLWQFHPPTLIVACAPVS